MTTATNTETSQEILDAINWLARGDEAEAQRIWEGPTQPELLAIWERVTKNGLIPAEQFVWGANLGNWAPQ